MKKILLVTRNYGTVCEFVAEDTFQVCARDSKGTLVFEKSSDMIPLCKDWHKTIEKDINYRTSDGCIIRYLQKQIDQFYFGGK